MTSSEGECAASAGVAAAGGPADAPFFSIVMPAYNAAVGLRQTVACVLEQTERDFELVIVDNGSTDATGVLADQLAAQDPRVRVVHLAQNGGPAGGRNAGIAQACGTYLWMPDADDLFDTDLLAKARAAIEGAGFPVDAVLFGYDERYYDGTGAFLYAHPLPMEPGAYADQNVWRRRVAGWERGTHYGYPWNKVYRLDHIRQEGLAFEQVRLIEDVTFNVGFFQNARGVVVVDGTPYHYVKREGTSVTNGNAYTAAEYWDLHQRRIQQLVDQLASWGVLDEGALGIVGSLYCRFVVSTVMRSFVPGDHWGARQRTAWLRELFRTPLFRQLVPAAQADQSRTLAMAIRALQARSVRRVTMIGHAAYLARGRAYGAFTKIRSGR